MAGFSPNIDVNTMDIDSPDDDQDHMAFDFKSPKGSALGS